MNGMVSLSPGLPLMATLRRQFAGVGVIGVVLRFDQDEAVTFSICAFRPSRQFGAIVEVPDCAHRFVEEMNPPGFIGEISKEIGYNGAGKIRMVVEECIGAIGNQKTVDRVRGWTLETYK